MITVTVGGAAVANGIAIACTGASTATGLAAIDRFVEHLVGTTTNPVLTTSLTTSVAGDGALAVIELFSETVSVEPSSPWTSTTYARTAPPIFKPQGAVSLNASNPAKTTSIHCNWTRSSTGNAVSVALVLIKPATVPGPPTGVTATPGNAQASVSFTAPTNNGGSAITGYTVTASTGQTATGSSSPIVVSGLTNGIPVTFTVKATNSSGTSTASSPSSAVTPGTVPSAPFLFGAGGGNTTVTLSWDAPATNGAAITGYNVYEGTTSGGESATPVNGSPIAGTSYVVTGLTNLTEYYFKVKAVNVWGASAVSNEITGTPSVPLTFVAAPTLQAVAGNDPRTGDPIVTLTVTNNEPAQTGVAPTVLATILRSDGAYVIGASPTFPLSVPAAGTVPPYFLYLTKTVTGEQRASSQRRRPPPRQHTQRTAPLARRTSGTSWGLGPGCRGAVPPSQHQPARERSGPSRRSAVRRSPRGDGHSSSGCGPPQQHRRC